MKKTIVIMFAFLLVLTIATTGCGSSQSVNNPGSPKKTETFEELGESAEIPESIGETAESAEDDDKDLSDTKSDKKPDNIYVGDYRNNSGEIIKVTTTDNGMLKFKNTFIDESNIDVNNLIFNEDGSFLAGEKESGPNVATSKIFIYPVGASLDVYNNETFELAATDNSKIRLYLTFSDVPDIRTNVYYKTQKLPENALSYLSKPGFLYEFNESGIISGNGEEWIVAWLLEYDESDDGILKENVAARYENGQKVSHDWMEQNSFIEDARGVYISEPGKYNSVTYPMLIKYPLKAGEEFQSSKTLGKAKVEAINETVTTKAGVFENVVVISYEFGEGGYGETKYFAPGVGLIKYEAIRNNGELVKISQ